MTFTTPVAVRTAPVTPAITDIAVSLICGQLRMNVSAMFLMIGVAVLPTHSTAWPILGIACSPNFCKCGIALSTRPVTAAPTSSFMLSNMRPILAVESADFSAVPPNWVSSSLRMMPWAPVTSPEAIIALACSFCWAVNWTPALDSEVMPFTGSLRALPSCMLALGVPASNGGHVERQPGGLVELLAGHFRERQEHRLGLNDLLSVDTDLHFHLVGHRRELADGLPPRRRSSSAAASCSPACCSWPARRECPA
ncbi:MAG: hypothetical protein IPH81_20475 [Candidatus Microthrix sp.]|nr:hypothetical protein [Candidatus Microthrix sp.]